MVSIVIPIYNEEEIFHLLHSAVTDAMAPTGEDYEIVYVNDGSRDRSLELLLAEQKRDPHVVVVDLSRNFGHMGAINAGLRTAKGDAVAVMDTINSLQEGNRYFPGLRAWVGYKNAIVYYDRQDRVGGDGKLSFMSRIKYAFDAIYSFSAKPLRVSVFSGLTCVAISAVMLLAMFA